MPCFHPLTAYRKSGYEFPDGKVISFDPRYSGIEGFETLQIPCGRCFGCRLQRSKDWALRIALENKFHEESCFITLTYSPEHLPSDGSLKPDDVTLFLKRLRKHFSDNKLRYFYCGEYGDKMGRPHYHMCLFGLSFLSDRKSYGSLWTSETLEKLWGKGFCPFGELTFDSAAYTARYILKKITGDPAEEHYNGRYPEFVRMSRMPGIGKDWLLKNKDPVYANDFITIKQGLKCRPPRYFDKLYDNVAHDYYKNVVKPRRQEKGVLLSADNTPDRLLVKEQVAREKLRLLKRRKLECGLL